MLTLPIKKKWFDMIVRGEKKEEYREITPYYTTRFMSIGLLDENGNATENEACITLRNGYGRNRPEVTVLVTLFKSAGLPQWGAEEGKIYYALRILGMYADIKFRLSHEYPY